MSTNVRPLGSDQSQLRREAPSVSVDTREDSPSNLLAAISWALLVTVMFGGYALLRLLSSGDKLSEFEEQFFRAGHAHAGVLSTLGILYSQYLGKTALSRAAQIRAWVIYLIAVLVMSGGFFVHMLLGEEGEGSFGTVMIPVGGVMLAGSVLFLAWQLYRNRNGDLQ